MSNIDDLIKKIMKEAADDGEPVTEDEAKEMAEMELKAKGLRHYEQSKAERKKTVREHKVDTDKKMLLDALMEALPDGIEARDIKNEAEFSFTYNKNEYTVKLIKHRPPKKK